MKSSPWTYPENIWTVDSIHPIDQEMARECEPGHLVRLVHLVPDAPGGIRYLFTQSRHIAVGDDRRSVQDTRLWYGRAFELDRRRLGELARNVSLPVGPVRLSALRADLSGVVSRRADVEETLRKEIAGYIEQAPTLPEREDIPFKSQGRTSAEKRGTVRVHILDVGQGDTILVELPGGNVWLVDAYFWTKTAYSAFCRWLRDELSIKKINRLVISHFHYDHIRSAVDVMTDFTPDEVVVNGTAPHASGAARRLLAEASAGGILRKLTAAQELSIGGVTVRLTTSESIPGVTGLGDDPNEHGIVACIRTGRSVALLPGDAPGRLLASFVTAGIAADDVLQRLYKVTHHCSRTGNDRNFFAHFPANWAATSCSAHNKYGHPHSPPRETIDALTAGSAPPGSHALTSETKRTISYQLTANRITMLR
jgi:competence protein ComEC